MTDTSYWVLRSLLFSAAVMIVTAAFVYLAGRNLLHVDHTAGFAALAGAVAIPAIGAIEAIVGAVRGREPLVHDWPIWLALWAAMASSAVLATVLLLASQPADATQGLIGIYLGLSAVTGWIIGHGRSQAIERRKKTFDLLIKLRESALLAEHGATIMEAFPPGQPVTRRGLAQMRSKQAEQVMSSVRYVANYYEFIALSLRSGDLDMMTFYESCRAHIEAFDRKCADVIEARRRESAAENGQAFEGLAWLVGAFARLKKEAAAKRARRRGPPD